MREIRDVPTISAVKGPKFDEACTKDTLGRMWEMKGELKRARVWRGEVGT